MSLRPIPGYSPNLQDYIDDPDKFNNRMQGSMNRPQILDDDLIRALIGKGSISRGTRRPDDIKRQPDPTEMPMPPAPLPTEVFMRPGPRMPSRVFNIEDLIEGNIFRGNPDEVYSIGVGERVPGMGDGLPSSPQMPAAQQQASGASFESDYIDWLESKPKPPDVRRQKTGRKGVLYKKKKAQYDKDIAAWEARKPSRATYITAPVDTAPADPAPTPPPDYVPPPTETPDKFEGRYVPPTSNLGTPDLLIPSNIVGQSFDPGFAARYLAGGTGETNKDAGNDMGMMVMPQRPEPPAGSVFGGYGQQAPMQALAPYAGMAQSQPMPTDFFPSYVPKPDPIYETVPRPETDQPATQPNAQPVMGGGG